MKRNKRTVCGLFIMVFMLVLSSILPCAVMAEEAAPAAQADDLAASEEEYPADGEWTYDDTVRLMAKSASRIYDGEPLTGDVLVYGLPSSFTIDIKAFEGRTEAGTSVNEVEDFSILNASGEDVTEHFTNVETIAGTLVVDPAPLIVRTGSAVKAFDGKPLTASEAALRLGKIYDPKAPAWRNTVYTAEDSAGVRMLYGVCGNTYVHGTNPFSEKTLEVTLSAGQKLTAYLKEEEEGGGLEFRIETVSEEELPDEVLRLYADNPAMLDQAYLDTSWDREVLKKLIKERLPEDLEVSQEDVLTDYVNAYIILDTAVTEYSGRALGKEEIQFLTPVLGTALRVTATGSRTETGISENTYKID